MHIIVVHTQDELKYPKAPQCAVYWPVDLNTAASVQSMDQCARYVVAQAMLAKSGVHRPLPAKLVMCFAC